MRLRITDRILVAVAGILLLAICAGIVAQLFFNVDLIGFAGRIFSSEAQGTRILLAGAAVILFLLGLYCLLVLFRHRRRKDKYFMQKNENGELAISVNALEIMVRKCLCQHEELNISKLYLENRKDGLMIFLRGSVAGGISIPLTIEVIQKQIRQYVTACSGVEIRGIKIAIDSSGEDAENAPFAIAAPAVKPLLQEAGSKDKPSLSEDSSEEEPVQAPAEPEKKEEPVQTGSKGIAPEIPIQDVPDDDRPLHQRLFSTPLEPCIVPEPPAEEKEAGMDEPESDQVKEQVMETSVCSEEPAATEAEILKQEKIKVSDPEEQGDCQDV